MKARLTISRPGKFFAFLLMALVTVVLATCVITVKVMTLSGQFVTMEKHKEIISILDEKIEEYAAIVESNDEKFKREHQELLDELTVSKETIVGKDNLIKDMNSKIDYVVDKYYYVFEQIDKKKTPNPITFSNLVTLDNECKKASLDPHMVVGLFNLESKFNTEAKNNTSTATGLGQFLKGTGNSIYNKFLDQEEKYDHATMATDGETAVKMTVAYLKYLLDNNGNDIKQALISYNGGELGPKYYEVIDNYMIAKTSRGITKAREYR